MGSKNCYAAVDDAVSAHEIGHCLGLFHTHENMVCPASSTSENAPTLVNSILVPGANCASAGDLLCDTPADPKYGGCPNNFDGQNCTFVNPSNARDYLNNLYIDPDNKIPHNIMSYRLCRNLITPDQNERIRDMLASDLSEVVSSFSHIKEVSGTETWSTPLHFNHDLLVTGDLTIATQVYFAPGFGIILDGELEINEAVLDVSPFENNCQGSEHLWKGISVIRPSVLRIYESEILNAETAIFYLGFGASDIQADGVTFKNNERSFKAIRTISGLAEFVNCDFIIDDEYMPNSYFSQVDLVHCSPTYFGNCDFIFESALSEGYSREGISAYNSQVIVMADSDFGNWTRAINVSQNIGTRITLVNESDFENNKFGIYSINFHKTIASENEFNISNTIMSSDGWGVYGSETRKADIHHNTIFSETSSVYSTGVHLDNTETENLALLENVFTELDIAFNGFSCGKYTGGLRLLCNSNGSNREFDFIATNGIGPRHGSQTKASGNTFSHADEPSESDFKTSGFTYQVDYYHSNGVSAESPLYASFNIFGIKAPPQSCAFSELIQDPFEGEDLDDYIELHEFILSGIEDREEEIGLATTSEEIEELTAELHILWLERDQNIRDAVSYTLVQEIVDYNDVRTALNLEEGFLPEIAKAFTYLDVGLDSVFLVQLNTIGMRVDLSGEEEDDLENLVLLNTLLVRCYSGLRHEGELTALEIDTVELIADGVAGFAKSQARELLTYFFGYDFETSPPFSINPGPIVTPVSSEELLVWPNPVKEWVFIEIPKGTGSGLITVCNINGVDVERLELEQSTSRNISIQTDAWLPGMYFFKLMDDTGKLWITKFVK